MYIPFIYTLDHIFLHIWRRCCKCAQISIYLNQGYQLHAKHSQNQRAYTDTSSCAISIVLCVCIFLKMPFHVCLYVCRLFALQHIHAGRLKRNSWKISCKWCFQKENTRPNYRWTKKLSTITIVTTAKHEHHTNEGHGHWCVIQYVGFLNFTTLESCIAAWQPISTKLSVNYLPLLHNTTQHNTNTYNVCGDFSRILHAVGWMWSTSSVSSISIFSINNRLECCYLKLDDT